MYIDSSESFEIVKNILLESIPIDTSIKKIKEDKLFVLITEEYKLAFLNDVSASFLSLCNGINKVKNIIDTLLNIYEVDYNTLTNDIIILIRDLQNKRIIHIEN